MTCFLDKGHAADLSSLKVNNVFQAVLHQKLLNFGDDRELTKEKMTIGCGERQAMLLQWEGH